MHHAIYNCVFRGGWGSWDGVSLGVAAGLGARGEIEFELEEKRGVVCIIKVISNFLFHATLEESTVAAEDANVK